MTLFAVGDGPYDDVFGKMSETGHVVLHFDCVLIGLIFRQGP
jgi:hypothetical protein